MEVAVKNIVLYDEDMEPVTFYEGQYYMFSNFSSFSIRWRGRWWLTSEHAYQAAKFTDLTAQEEIRRARSAHDAKKFARAREHLKRADWDSVRLGIMEEVVRTKLEQHPFIGKRLLETGNREIVENSDTDSYWGWGPDQKGENNLGKIWMRLRRERQTPAA